MRWRYNVDNILDGAIMILRKEMYFLNRIVNLRKNVTMSP
jgi:hypothetical protein